MYTSLLLLTFACLAQAAVIQQDFTGIGNIHVLESDDWRTATPKQKVGCLDDRGKFVSNTTGAHECGVYTRSSSFPYTLSTKQGNCTFEDKTQERNTDSKYGQSDYAWNCASGYPAEIYDQLYTITGFPYVFLCSGDVACYYDAKKVPKTDDALSLWQYHWGTQQQGITPGHVQLQLMWEKIGDLTKRENSVPAPGPRLQIDENVQVPLLGSRARN